MLIIILVQYQHRSMDGEVRERSVKARQVVGALGSYTGKSEHVGKERHMEQCCPAICHMCSGHRVLYEVYVVFQNEIE